MTWPELHSWWTRELEGDPAYETVVTPLLFDVLDVDPEQLYLDLGCGEGRLMRRLGAKGAGVVGVDIAESLALLAADEGPVVVAELPSLGFFLDSVVDAAYCVLVLEHLADEERFFAETARVVRSSGTLSLVINHPSWTAPDSTPITDDDGEVLWRPGEYFSRGSSQIPAGEGASITFHHRSMAQLLNAASHAGWCLVRMVEQPHHDLEDQSGIPRLLACQWRLLP